jgi:hypothetical protein
MTLRHKEHAPVCHTTHILIAVRDHQSGEVVKLIVCIVPIPVLVFRAGFVFLGHFGKLGDEV